MRRSPVVAVAIVFAVLSLLGPLAVLVAMLLGANPLDAFGGETSNTPEALATGGLIATLFIGAPIFLMSLVALIRYRRGDPRAMWLPAFALAGPALLLVILGIGLLVQG